MIRVHFLINKLNIEPLSRTKEMKEVINIIIESLNLYDYDEEEEEEAKWSLKKAIIIYKIRLLFNI